MLDYQRIVDDVRSSLLWQDADNLDFMRSAAADYLVACDDVNERLRNCGSLLKQGQRSEAIRLCEVEPNLLDVVATLDFPERQQWHELITRYGIIAPPPLMLEWASVLNEAYAIEQPLADLLRRLRLAALAHSPLKVRIDLLRKLALCDIDNPVWQEDQVVFERERHKQLAGEITSAAQAGDLNSLVALDEEIRDPGWLAAPASALVQRIVGARATLEQRETRSELEELAQQLNDAFANFDVEAGNALREPWKTRARACALSEGDPLFQRSLPALQWLDEQDELSEQQSKYDSAVRALERSLDSGQPADELIERYHAAKSNGFALPDYLVNRYRTRLEILRKATKRRWTLAISGTAAGMLILATLIAALVFYKLHEAEATRQATEFAKVIDAKDLPAATAFLTALKQKSPGVADSEQITALADRLQKLIQEDEERHTSFVAALDKARQSLPSPDGSTKQQLLDRDALQEATQLATTKSERADVAKVDEAFKRIDRDYQTQVDHKFAADLDALNTAITKLAASSADDPAAVESQIDQLRKQLDDLKLRRDTISADVGAAAGIQAAHVRLTGFVAVLKQRREEDDAEQRLTDAVGNPGAYQEAVSHFVERCKLSPRAISFRQVQSEGPLWIGMDQWDRFVALWGRKDATTMNPQEATKWLEAARLVLKDGGDYPDVNVVQKRLPYLEAVTHRIDADQQPIQTPLRKLFSDPLVATVWMVELTSRERYYFLGDPGLNPTSITRVNYISDFSMKEMQKSGGLNSQEVIFNAAAPQTKLADSVKSGLNHLEDSNWDASFFKIVQMICANDNKIDPLLKLNLLQQTLEVGCRGSQCLTAAFGDLLIKLKESNVDPAANWLDPKDKVATLNRERAEKVLKDFENLGAIGKAAAEDFQSLRKPFGQVYRWVGWLRKGRDGKWQCVGSSLREESGGFFVVQGEIGHSVKLDSIGGIQQGIQDIRPSTGSSLVEGRPVYLLPPLAQAQHHVSRD